MRKGFTLLELSYVIAIIGILAAATIPAWDILVRKARSAEARTLLESIAHAELQHYRDHGAFLACPAEGPVPQRAGSFPATSCWRDLNVHVAGEVRYRYSVILADGWFQAVAEGDLDRDGVPSRYTLDGRSLAIDVVDELE